MLRWLGLVGLRTKTLVVIEREYGAKLEVAGGRDSDLFNKSTRLARDFGGNEYDAAAVFMAADTAVRLRHDAESRIAIEAMMQIAADHLPLMRKPTFVHEAMERALAAVGIP